MGRMLEIVGDIILYQILPPEDYPHPSAAVVSQIPVCTNCDEPETVDHLGAGANAASETNMIINEAANPLSELVWSPRTGLTLKYAGSSSLGKNSSILWNTDLASMMVMSSESSKDETNDNVSANAAADVAQTVVAAPLMSSASGTALAGKSPAQSSDENVEFIPLPQLRIGERSSGLNGQIQCAETKSYVHIDLNDNSIANEGAMVEKNLSANKSGSSGRSLNKRSDSGIRICGDINSCKLDQPPARNVHLSSSESREDKNADCVAKPISGPCTSEGSMLRNINLSVEGSGRNKEEDVHRNSQQVKKDDFNFKSLMIVDSSRGKRKVNDESSSDKGARANDGSHGSVESSNIGDVYASKKRPWIPELICSEANKKMKKHSGSFMNWLSSAATGHPIVRNDEQPLLAVPVSSSQLVSGVHHTLPLNDRKVSSEKGTGFGKFFQAMCSQASFKEDLNEKRPSSETDDSYTANAKGKLEMLKKISTEGYPNVNKNINFFVGEACSLDNKIVALPEEGKPSSSSSLKDDSSSQDVRVINKNDPLFPDSLRSSTGGGDGDGDGGQNMWISRFRSNASNLEESKINLNIPVNHLICSYGHLSPSQVKDNVVGTDEPSSEDQAFAIGKNLQECDAGGLRAIHGDLKSKAKVHPIMPSKKFRSTEDFASIFAKRLDALKNIASSKSMEGGESNTFCLYCGMRGHTLRGCSEIHESELEDLLSNFNLCGGEEDASFLCVRCFRLTHWAVSCPYALKQTAPDRQFGFKTYPTLGPRITSSSGNKNETSQPSHSGPIFQGVSSRVNDIFLSSEDEKTLDDAIPKDHASSLKVHELIKCWKAALFNSEKALPVPNQLFHTIGKLRLTRSDLLECMSLPPPYMNLEGYFLRVRLGKWVEGLGATGYHVARIVGTDQSGSSNSSIYVDLGNFKCPIDLRYVSNNDFTQEELKAWWIANIRGDGKLPTEEELNALLLSKEKPYI